MEHRTPQKSKFGRGCEYQQKPYQFRLAQKRRSNYYIIVGPEYQLVNCVSRLDNTVTQEWLEKLFAMITPHYYLRMCWLHYFLIKDFRECLCGVIILTPVGVCVRLQFGQYSWLWAKHLAWRGNNHSFIYENIYNWYGPCLNQNEASFFAILWGQY